MAIAVTIKRHKQYVESKVMKLFSLLGQVQNASNLYLQHVTIYVIWECSTQICRTLLRPVFIIV